jgi:hypothetical protein
MIELTKAEKLDLLAKANIAYTVIRDGKITTDKYGYIKVEPTNLIRRCWCRLNKGAEISSDEVCMCCGGKNSTTATVITKAINTLADEELKKTGKTKSYKYQVPSQNVTLGTMFYVREHPNKEAGIQIMKISVSIKGGNTALEQDELVWKIVHVIDIVPNEGSRAYKYARGKEVDIDMFDAFQLNSKLLKDAPNVYFENACGMIDFVLKHKKFNQYTGFMQCFNLADVVIPRNSFFMFYMYLYAQYPVVEFVVKMGYIDLVAKIMKNLANGYNKDNIRIRAAELSKILNCEATNGSMALTAPKYIADDLNLKEAEIDEYVLWGDICQMSEDGPISKENYIAATRNNVYPHLYFRRLDIPNILKYGYTMKEFIKYMRKQVMLCAPNDIKGYTYADYGHILTCWRDYLNMCDLMCVKHEKFPMNIKSAHDNILIAFRAYENIMADKMIDKIANMAEKCIPDTNKYNDSQYVIVMPHNITDVVQEGQAQHNCVGSYINRIAKKQSLVFFIRKKEDPTTSLVTAEYRNGKITQLYYKNNQHVNDKEIIEIANTFRDRLIRDREFAMY